MKSDTKRAKQTESCCAKHQKLLPIAQNAHYAHFVPAMNLFSFEQETTKTRAQHCKMGKKTSGAVFEHPLRPFDTPQSQQHVQPEQQKKHFFFPLLSSPVRGRRLCSAVKIVRRNTTSSDCAPNAENTYGRKWAVLTVLEGKKKTVQVAPGY